MKSKQDGGVLMIVLVIAAVVILGGALWWVWSQNQREGGNGQQDTNAEAMSQTIRSWHLCDIVNIHPLVEETMQSTFSNGPVSIPYGAGTDPGGVGCNGQINPPPIVISKTTMERTGNVLTSVVPYSSVEAAAEDYTTRLYERGVDRLRSLENIEVADPEPIEGPWDQAVTYVSTGTGYGIYGLAQKGSYLIRVDVIYDSDTGRGVEKGYPFTIDDVKQGVRQLLLNIGEAVEAELNK